ncbi:hypothetical protein C8J56DRAFT_938690 [Mycena floridula]|nr:hypothetical protein C8J56DRAFT_938690 [Mycena floridula]
MFSSPTPAPGSRKLASTALKKAGLMDKDTMMRDVTDNAGGRKGTNKFRNHRHRPIDALKNQGPHNLLARLSSPSAKDESVSIRGASTNGRVVTTLSRLRRNAVSGPTLIPTTKKGTSVVQPWKDLVQKRWNPELRLLNLSTLIDDEIVKKNNLLLPGYGGSGREISVILKLASNLKPEVQSIDLSNNNLSGEHLTALGHYLPRLANLSLSNNKLRWKDIDLIAGGKKEKMLHLKELILFGNPAREVEVAGGEEAKYRSSITKRFPSLTMLDQHPVPQIVFDGPSTSGTNVPKPSARVFPFEMGPSLICGVDNQLLINFLVRFFTVFDTQRQALEHVYHPASTFSYSANTSHPERAKIQGHHKTLPNQYKMSWSPWLNQDNGGSRNLSRLIQSLDKQVQRMHVGGQATVNAVLGLPSTRHDLSGPAEMFCLDCFPVVHGQQMALMVTVHGQFVELPAEGIRSFDRTFIIVPAPDGSAAKLNGWDVQIISDQWTIRGYSHHDAWKPGPMLVQALAKHDQPRAPRIPNGNSGPVELPPDQQADIMQLPQNERELIVELCGRTALNVRFAYDCLKLNEWDLTKAIINYHEVRTTLKEDAYLPGKFPG